MPTIRITGFIAFAFAIFWISSSVNAKSGDECLNHLGGGYGDVICYNGLSSDLVSDSRSLYKNIKNRIPKKNPESDLLDKYMAAQDNSVQFCKLKRDAGTEWKESPDGSMYPMLYAKCIYDLRKAQNLFLQDISAMSKW